MVQKAGKFGRLQVTRLQIHYGVTQAETTLFSFEELQSFDLPMTRFPFLLHHKGALIFQIKRPLFWKNGRICPSLSETDTSSCSAGGSCTPALGGHGGGRGGQEQWTTGLHREATGDEVLPDGEGALAGIGPRTHT